MGAVATADRAGFRRDDGPVPEVTEAARLGQGEGHLVDALPALLTEPRRFVKGRG